MRDVKLPRIILFYIYNFVYSFNDFKNFQVEKTTITWRVIHICAKRGLSAIIYVAILTKPIFSMTMFVAMEC